MTKIAQIQSPAPASRPERPIRHFNQIDLSRRWNISPRTLERWRWLKQGPEYLKIGGHVVYRLEDIERYEGNRAKNIAVRTANSTAAEGNR